MLVYPAELPSPGLPTRFREEGEYHRGVLTADSAQVPPKRPEQLTSLEQDLTRDGAAQRARHQPDRHVGYDISAGKVAPYPSCCPTAASTGGTLLSGRQKAADVQNHLLLNNQP